MDYSDSRKERSKPKISSRHQSTSEEEDGITSRNELRQKSKEMHQFLKHHHSGKRNGDFGEVVSFASNSNLDTLIHTNSNSRSHSVSRSHNETLTEFDNRSSNSDSVKSKEVLLTSDFSRLSGNESDGVEMCQKLFGVVVFQYSNGNSDWNNPPSQRQLVVQGLVEGSRAQTCGKIQRGDMLMKVNKKEVTWLNLFKVLSAVKKREKVKLTFQSPRVVGPKSSYEVLQVPGNDLCLALLGKRLDQILLELSQYPCLLLYLTFDSSSNSEAEIDLKEDIIYAFPGDEERLTSIRGLFITLTATVTDVVNQSASTSFVALSDSSVSVVYHPCGRDVLILVLPQGCMSMHGKTHILDALHSLLVLLYGNAKSAFVNADRQWLDKLVSVLLHNALGLDPCSPSFHDVPPSSRQLSLPPDSPAAFCQRIPVTSVSRYWSVKDLPLSHENKLICDEILTEYESMEFDDHLEKDELFTRRKYVILGCSLYYKDYLLRSHLPSPCQKDVNLFLNCHGLLSLSARLHTDQVFVWQELKTCSGHMNSTLLGYTPSVARHFLMVVGMDHYLLAVWLELRGFPSLPQGPMHPLPIFIDQGKATLAQLETAEVHMARCCLERLNSQGECLQLASADQLCVQTFSPRNRLNSNEMTSRRAGGTSSKPAASPSKGGPDRMWKSRSKSVDRLGEVEETKGHGDLSLNAIKRQGSKISFESNDSAGSGSSTGLTKGKGSSVSSIGDLSSISRSTSVLHIKDPFQGHNSLRICRGKESAVMYYMTFDLLEGVLICPTNVEINSVLSPLHQDVLYNFHVSCQRMAQNFCVKRDQAAKTPEGSLTSDVSACATNVSHGTSMFDKGTEPVVEQGVLFSCSIDPASVDRKSGPVSLDYWVLGRRQTGPSVHEMYVCFHESTHQQMVELAFSLGFGS